MIKIQIILGSTRPRRFSEKPGKWIFELLQKRAEIAAELIDLRDYPLPFFDEPISPAMSKGGYSNKAVEKWANKVAEADGYIMVTPEYNHGYSAVLKNALDYLYYEWNNKPVGFVAYGGMGGARAVEQLREVAVELQMVPIRDAVHIPAFWALLDKAGNLKTETLNDSAKAMLDVLIRWAKILKQAREKL